MRVISLYLFFMSCTATTALAQSQEEINSLNAAWGEYQAAMATTDIALRITSSKKVLDLGRAVFDDADERVPLLMINYGIALTDGKRVESANEVFTEALELAEAIHGEDSVELVPILVRLADTDGRTDGRARHRLFKQAMKIVAADSGKDSDTYATLLMSAGISLYGSDDWKAGRRYVSAAHEYYKTTIGDDSYQAGVAAFHLGKFAFYQRNYRSATEYLESALEGFGGDSEEALQFQLHTRALLVATLESRGQSDRATEHCVAIGRLSKYRGNQDYEPLFRMAPQYPPQMLAQGQQGFVDVAFTVDESGFVRNAEVINKGRRDQGFVDAALEAVERFRYAPKFEDGEAVAVNDVKTRITFALED